MARGTLKFIGRIAAPNLWLGFKSGTVLAGLLVHPYKTVADVIDLHLPSAVILAPLLLWLVAIVVLRLFGLVLFAILPFFGLWFFLSLWITSFFALWQLVLIYLFLRFSR
jgi:hypothetical protein